jgi:hypothetical protein
MASTIKVDQIEGSTGSTITVPTGQTLTLTDGLAIGSLPTVTVAKGGTGLAGGFTAGDVLYATGATTLAKLPKGTAEQILSMNSGATAPEWTSVDVSVGGTGLASFTAGDILYATGATTLAKLAKGTASQALKMNAGATAPEWVTSAGGSILQVKTVQCSTYRSTTNTSLGTSAYELTDYTTTFTPTASTSHILITGGMAFGHDADYTGRGYLTYNHSGISETVIKSNINSYGMTWRIEASNNTASSTRGNSSTGVNIHLAPATTNEITFKVRVMTSNTASPIYINGTDGNATDSNDGGNDISSLTFWEIATGITPVVSNSAIAT